VDDDGYLEELLDKAAGWGVGHNSEAETISRVNNTIDYLVRLSEEHKKSLEALVDQQTCQREEVLLALGKELLPHRKKHKGDREFGKWCNDNFPNLSKHVNMHEQLAILWAAEFPHQCQEMLDKYPRVKTTRGAHAKWLEENKHKTPPPNQVAEEEDEEDDVVDEEEEDEDVEPEDTSEEDNSNGEEKGKKPRPQVVVEYNLKEAMSAITGMAWLYAKNYKGTSEDAADVLVQEIIGVCEDGDDIDLSIAKDRIKWFLEFKEALDYAEPALREFLTDKPNLKIVK